MWASLCLSGTCGNQRTNLVIQLFLSTMWLPGTEDKIIMLCIKCLYPLIHLTCPLNFLFLHLFRMCVCGGGGDIHRSLQIYGIQQTTLRSWYSSFTALVPGMELRLWGLATNIFICWVLLVTPLPGFWVCFSKWTGVQELTILRGNKPQGSTYLLPCTGLQRSSVVSGYYVGGGDPNSGPQVCITSILHKISHVLRPVP